MTTFDEFRSAYPPRADVAARPPGAWRDAERTLGTALPLDYRALVDAYGMVGIAHYIWIYVPAASDPGCDISMLVEHCGKVVALSPAIEESGLGAYPGEHGLLCWAFTEGGAMIAWETVGPPDSWPVVLVDRDGVNLERFSGGAVEFLAAVMAGKRFESILPDDFPATPRLTWPDDPFDPSQP